MFSDKAYEAVANTSVGRVIIFDATSDDESHKPSLTAFHSLLSSNVAHYARCERARRHF